MGDVRQVQFGGGTSRTTPQAEGTAPEAGNVVDLGAFRTRKSLSADRKVSIGEAFSGTPSAAAEARLSGRGEARNEVELSERIERIKNSINRINQLMSELRGAAKDDEGKDPSRR